MQSTSSENAKLVKPDYWHNIQSSFGKWQCTVGSKENRNDCVNISFLFWGGIYSYFCYFMQLARDTERARTCGRAGWVWGAVMGQPHHHFRLLSWGDVAANKQSDRQTDHQTDKHWHPGDSKVEIRRCGCRLKKILLKTRCFFCNGLTGLLLQTKQKCCPAV